MIKSAQNPGFIDRLFGSDDMHLLRKCPCPVWLTRPGEPLHYQSILAAVDFDQDPTPGSGADMNRRILEVATSSS